MQGTVTFRMQQGKLSVNLTSRGHAPDVPQAQHIHMNATCDNPGGILVPLDDDLSEVGGFFGNQYPTPTNQGGAVTYRQSVALSDLALSGAGTLDLGNRVVVLHGNAVSPFPLVACGEVNPVNH